MYSLIFLKAKNEEKLKNWIIVKIKIRFAHFKKIQIYFKNLILIFLFEDCPLMYKKGICKFSKKY